MRLVTRGDLDGLAGAVIITSIEQVDEIVLIHPQDITDRRFEVHQGDILVNLPYDDRCSMWFDHHLLTDTNQKPPQKFVGGYGLAPSAARLVYEFYLERDPAISRFSTLIDETDRLDSANLRPDDVTDPKGYILLGYTIDNRSGLGTGFKQYFQSLLDLLKTMPIEKVLEQPEVSARVERLKEEEATFRAALLATSRMEGNVVVTDLRSLDSLPAGNRFLIYTLFPKANVSLRIHWGPKRESVIAAVGHSIFDRSCRTSVGELMAQYGGGGHRGAGTCKIPVADAERALAGILGTLKANG